MSCDNIYCRIKARKRLIEKGYSEEESKRISEDIYKKVKELVDKHAKRI